MAFPEQEKRALECLIAFIDVLPSSKQHLLENGPKQFFQKHKKLFL
jgi:hypothetical protein